MCWHIKEQTRATLLFHSTKMCRLKLTYLLCACGLQTKRTAARTNCSNLTHPPVMRVSSLRSHTDEIVPRHSWEVSLKRTSHPNQWVKFAKILVHKKLKFNSWHRLYFPYWWQRVGQWASIYPLLKPVSIITLFPPKNCLIGICRFRFSLISKNCFLCVWRLFSKPLHELH